MIGYDMGIAPMVVFILLLTAALVDLGIVVWSMRRGEAAAGRSISSFMINLGKLSPLGIFVLGVIAGHLFFYMENPNCPGEQWAGVVWNRYTLLQCVEVVIGYELVRQIVVRIRRRKNE